MAETRGSDTLMMLQDFCQKDGSTDTSVGVVMEALEKIRRLDALRVLTNHLSGALYINLVYYLVSPVGVSSFEVYIDIFSKRVL